MIHDVTYVRQLFGAHYSKQLAASMQAVYDDVYKNLSATFELQIGPAPVLRVNGKLQLETRTEYITTRVGTLTGISLKLFGKTSSIYTRLLRAENVPYTTSKAEQLRILRAMCDIVAVQEQADYRLVKAMKALPAHKEHLRPKKGKYG